MEIRSIYPSLSLIYPLSGHRLVLVAFSSSFMLLSLNDKHCAKELTSSHSCLRSMMDKTLSAISFSMGGGASSSWVGEYVIFSTVQGSIFQTEVKKTRFSSSEIFLMAKVLTSNSCFNVLLME